MPQIPVETVIALPIRWKQYQEELTSISYVNNFLNSFCELKAKPSCRAIFFRVRDPIYRFRELQPKDLYWLIFKMHSQKMVDCTYEQMYNEILFILKNQKS